MPAIVNPFEQTFLDFIAKRELRVPRLRDTGEILGFSSHGFGAGLDEIEWVPASGRARLYSYVVYRLQYHADFPPPYTVAQVELDEGPRLTSTVLANDDATLRIDMSLLAQFDHDGRLVFVPETSEAFGNTAVSSGNP